MIIGHSYVLWAARYAATSACGSNLGLGTRAQIEWKGLQGMQWGQLCRVAAFGLHPPDVWIIHLGSNDLARYGGKALILDVICDLIWLRVLYPEMSILWSTIIPWLMLRAAKLVQRNVNREVCRAVCNGFGLVIGHREICTDRPEHFWHGGVHLSDRGFCCLS